MTASWHDNLKPLDKLTEFADDLKPLVDEADQPDLDDVTQDRYRGLDADTSYLRTPRKRSYIDLTHVAHAKDHITRLPEEGETVHAVISGRYPLWALVPAVVELAGGAAIEDLHLITLSYGKDNAADLVEMLDAGTIRRVWLMVSHYFAHANPHLYDPLAHELGKRGHHVLALRTHAKIILIKLTDGRTYVVESSANLRSCKNIEQLTFTRDRGLYDFHREWVGGLFASAAEIDRNEQTDTNGAEDGSR